MFTKLSIIIINKFVHRLEEVEETKQKLQLEKMAVDSKVKKQEEDLAVQIDTNTKVSYIPGYK